MTTLPLRGGVWRLPDFGVSKSREVGLPQAFSICSTASLPDAFVLLAAAAAALFLEVSVGTGFVGVTCKTILFLNVILWGS